MLLVPPNLNQAGGGHIPCLTNLWVTGLSRRKRQREPGEGGQTHPGSWLDVAWALSPPTQGLGSTAVNESVAASPSPPLRPHPSCLPISAHTHHRGVGGGRGALPWWLRQHLPAMQETWVQSLAQEDPQVKEMAPPSSTLAWKNPMDGGAW